MLVSTMSGYDLIYRKPCPFLSFRLGRDFTTGNVMDHDGIVGLS
jgi:hypothetical protein